MASEHEPTLDELLQALIDAALHWERYESGAPEVEKARAAILAHVDGIKAERDAANARAIEVGDKYDALRAAHDPHRYKRIEAERDAARTQHWQATTDWRAAIAERDALQRDLLRLEKRAEDWRNTLTRVEAERDQAIAAIEARTHTLAKWIGKCMTLKRERDQATAQTDQYRRELNALSTTVLLALRTWEKERNDTRRTA